MWTKLAMLTIVSAAAVTAQTGSCDGMSLGPGANLNGFVPFPASNLWNQDISTMPVDPNSQNIIDFIGQSVTLHPDFGAGLYQGSTIGIPYQVEAGTQARVAIKLGAYRGQSDWGPMPVPAGALIEGYPHPGNGDRHVLVLETQNCWLYELYHARALTGGGWSADSAAIWDLLNNEQRPYTWTSADAAGLPIFVGLARYDEVAAGAIHHALRFTVPTTRQAFVLPATHWASSDTDPNAPPMGARLRLKASFDISGYPPHDQAILTALKTYGMILADNGSGIYLSGAPDSRWNNNALSQLKQVTGSDFEVVQMGTIYTPGNIPTGPAPVIASFTANPPVITAGSPVTLTWSVSGSEYNTVSPTVGVTRANSVTLTPAKTTTYTLRSTNLYGRAVATATVTVQ